MTDTDLLLKRLRETPDDEALMSALSDEFREAGEDRKAEAVLEYRNVYRLRELAYMDGDSHSNNLRYHQMYKLGFLFGLNRIEVGDFLYYDDKG